MAACSVRWQVAWGRGSTGVLQVCVRKVSCVMCAQFNVSVQLSNAADTRGVQGADGPANQNKAPKAVPCT